MTGVIETICPVFGFSISRHPLPEMTFAGRGNKNGKNYEKNAKDSEEKNRKKWCLKESPIKAKSMR